jgi:putative membrane protein
MMWNDGGWAPFGMGFGLHWVFFVLFWGLIIFGAIALYRLAFGAARGPSGQGGASGEDSAVAIVRQRYARGELTNEQYQALLQDLRKST